MKRIVGIVLAFGALALIPSVSRAQSDDWQIITGPGYSFQVPGDWQSRQAPSANARIALSTDSNQAAYAFEASPAVPAGLSSLDARRALLPDAMQAALSPTPDESDFVVGDGPTPIQVAGADAALMASASYVAPNGTPADEYVVVATRGAVAFTFILDLTADYDAADPGFAQTVLASFQIQDF